MKGFCGYYIKSAAEWDIIRRDPRFKEMVERMNIPESQMIQQHNLQT